MKFRKLLALIAVFVVLAGVSFLKKIRMEKAERSVNTEAVSAEINLGPEIAVSQVTDIEIRRGTGDEEKILLKKDAAGAWIIPSRYGGRARKEIVEGLLSKLSTLRGELRSDNPSALEDFQITGDKAIHLRLSGERELAHFLLSSLRPRGTQNFLRLDGSPDVIATTSDVLSDLAIFEKDAKLSHRVFADLRPVGLDSSKVASVELTPPGAKTLIFTKNEDLSWALDGDASAVVDAQKMNEFFAALYNLWANDTLDPAANPVTAQTPWLRLRMKAQEKPENLELWLGARNTETKTALVKTLPDGIVYEISDTQIDNLTQKTKDSFLKPKGA